VSIDDITLVHLALSLRAQKRGIGQDDATNGRGELTRDHGRRHTPHRVAQQNRRGKSEPLDESNDIACVILVTIPTERRARIPRESSTLRCRSIRGVAAMGAWILRFSGSGCRCRLFRRLRSSNASLKTFASPGYSAGSKAGPLPVSRLRRRSPRRRASPMMCSRSALATPFRGCLG